MDERTKPAREKACNRSRLGHLGFLHRSVVILCGIGLVQYPHPQPCSSGAHTRLQLHEFSLNDGTLPPSSLTQSTGSLPNGVISFSSGQFCNSRHPVLRNRMGEGGNNSRNDYGKRGMPLKARLKKHSAKTKINGRECAPEEPWIRISPLSTGLARAEAKMHVQDAHTGAARERQTNTSARRASNITTHVRRRTQIGGAIARRDP